MTQPKKKVRASVLSGPSLDVAKNLIADLIGEHDRTLEQGSFRLMPEMLPEEMAFERGVLRVMESLQASALPPSRNNLLLRLSLEHENATERLERLLSYRSQRPNVTALAMSLSEFTGRLKIEHALREAIKLSQQSGLSNAAAYEQISELLSAAAPRARNVLVQVQDDAEEQFWAYQERMAAIAQAGGTLGPTFPWLGLQKLIPYLIPGDVTLILAQTGFGKSTAAQLIAEHVAHNIGGYDVGFYHMETKALQMEERRACRRLPIHGYDILKTTLNASQTKRRDWLAQETRRLQREKGTIRYHWCPGVGWEEFEARVTADAIRCEAEGKRYLCIVDYFQKFGTQGYSSPVEAYNNIAAKIKDLAQSLDIYMVVFAQDQPKSSKKFGETEGGDEDENTPWGAKAIIFYSQAIIKLLRQRNADGDSKWMEEDGTGQRRDILGQLMYWHRKGQINSLSRWKVTKANNGSPGEANVLFANGFFDIVDAEVETRNFTD